MCLKCYVGISWRASQETLHEHVYFRAFRTRSVIALRTGRWISHPTLINGLFLSSFYLLRTVWSHFFIAQTQRRVVPYHTSSIITIVNSLLLVLKGISCEEKQLREISSTARYFKWMFFVPPRMLASIMVIFQDNICGKTRIIIYLYLRQTYRDKYKTTKLKPFFKNGVISIVCQYAVTV